MPTVFRFLWWGYCWSSRPFLQRLRTFKVSLPGVAQTIALPAVPCDRNSAYSFACCTLWWKFCLAYIICFPRSPSPLQTQKKYVLCRVNWTLACDLMNFASPGCEFYRTVWYSVEHPRDTTTWTVHWQVTKCYEVTIVEKTKFNFKTRALEYWVYSWDGSLGVKSVVESEIDKWIDRERTTLIHE